MDYLKILTNMLVIFILFFMVSYCDCLFVSYINAKGLKGNVTFDVREETNESILVIESFIESELLILTSKFDTSQPVLLEWSLHLNPINPNIVSTCSTDELGATVSENLKNSLTKDRSIVLNKLNSWRLPLKELLQSNSASSLSSLIWGKSIRIKLSETHADKIPVQVPKTATPTSNTQTARVIPNAPTGLSKPQLTIVSPVASSPSKPSFAPRPKPSITAKLKVPTAPSLPKVEATRIKRATDGIDEESTLVATHRRIVAVFGRIVVCGSIIDTRKVKTSEAIFETQIAGKVTMRGNEDDTTLIMVNLYHIKSKLSTRHDWKILASDILDNGRHEEKCKYLQNIFDPNNVDDSGCKPNETEKCKMGDLTKKHGQLQVAGLGKNTRTTLIDLNLPLSSLEGSRVLFLVIYEAALSKPNILSCAQIRSVNSRKLEAGFNMDGVRGTIRMAQRHPSEPTTISYDLFGLEGNIKHQTIRELPLKVRSSSDNSKLCNTLGDIFDPHKKQSTFDSIQVGNLSAKHDQLSVIDSEYEDHYMGEYTDLSIQLYGTHTVAGRSIVLHKNNGDPWVCATLEYIDEPVSLAVATFHYPVVGKISFQQLTNDPRSETGVLIEVFNPNSEKNTEDHNWMVHLKPAMADFYNWSQRCESSGEIYDPLQSATSFSNELYSKQCLASMLNEPLRCRSGDTGLKSGHKLSLPISYQNMSRFYYTDLFLPLSESNSIIGRSVVIYDEHAPTQRGNRLACASIKLVHPLKAAIRSWNSGPSIPSAVYGSIVFQQETPLRSTKIQIDLSGFNGNVENYAIHNAWTMDDREFPCSNDSLYDIYDPYDNENSLRLPPSAHYGSLATVDRVKVGDMSRKHGTFEGLQGSQKSLSDANAPLFAPRSIVGRSLVLRAAVNDFRWVCGNIELEYDKGQSREIIGIASFDEPRSKIAGYVRFVQLEHKDGSLSDTYIQVDLKMQSDGVHELQTSDSHNWVVFVNQVGEDAYIAADEVRCIASGFKWNPYLAQDNLETYASSCSSGEPLACAMGDLGLRHGSLIIGPNNRRTMSDSNLPLAGNYSVMGRSLIIFDNKRPTVKLACANIFPDIHLKSNVVIKRIPSFTVARFVEQMRSLLGAAEWLMVPELKATKSVANGECVQMTIHFYGQKAQQMQVELNNLITLGTVRKATRVGVDKISTHYKLCRTNQMQLTSSATTMIDLSVSFSVALITSLLMTVILL